MGLGDRTRLLDTPPVQVLAVLAQVPLVGLEGVLRGALLDPDMVEPAADLPVERGGLLRRRRNGIGQDSASSSVIDPSPWASATGA